MFYVPGGLVIILINGILILALLLQRMSSRSQRNRDRVDTTIGRISWSGAYTEAFQRALDVLGALGAELLNADPNHGFIIAATPALVRSFGSTVQIAMQTQEGVTMIEVEAAAAVPLLDGGASRRFVDRFLQAWDELPHPVRQA